MQVAGICLKAYTLFLDAQAGILASKLQENTPCPVCGSSDHPSPAPLKNNPPTQEQLRAYHDARFGLGCDLRLNDRLSINIEANANALSDKFNSKKAGNCDWQLNALVGVSIKLGKSYTKTAPVYYEAEPVVVEQPKPAPVIEQPQPKKEVVIESMKQNIFFALNSVKIQDDQQSKINSLVDYLEKHDCR